jgi:predicted Zn-dependent protease
MKCSLVLWLMLGLTSQAGAQANASSTQIPTPRPEIIESVCRGGEIASGAAYDQMVRIKQRLGSVLKANTGHHIRVALVTGNVINAWNADLNPSQSLVCIPISMVIFMSGAEGELGFIVSHEVGHALDDACKTASGRTEVAIASQPFSAFVGGLLGGRYSTAVVQQSCEARADAIGFALFTAAGYNPFDAAGAFGRLEMYMGDTSTTLVARFAAFGKDHPVTPDRIRQMRAMLVRQLMTRTTGRR